MKSQKVDELSLEDLHAAIRMYTAVSKDATVKFHLVERSYCAITNTPISEDDDVDPRSVYRKTEVVGATVTS